MARTHDTSQLPATVGAGGAAAAGGIDGSAAGRAGVADGSGGAVAGDGSAGGSPGLRILHLRSGLGLFGAEGVLLTLARQTAARHQVEVGVLRDPRHDGHLALAQAAREAGLEVVEMESGGRFDPRVVLRLRRLLRERGVDVLHTHDYKTTVIGSAATRRSTVRHVVTLHGDTAETRAVRIYEAVCYRTLRFAAAVATVSEELRQRAACFVPAARLLHIRNGIDLDAVCAGAGEVEDLRASLGLRPGTRLVGAVGRLGPEKGHAVLVEAAAEIAEKLRWPPGTAIVVVGEGPLGAGLRAQVRAHGVQDLVHFVGGRSRMAPFYAAIDMLVQPSLREGLPLTVLEAMAFGLPIVASRVGEITDVLEEGAAGVLVEPGDPAALGRALFEGLSDLAGARQRGARARARVHARYGAAAMAEAYERLVYGCSAGASGGAGGSGGGAADCGHGAVDSESSAASERS
jgi:glycosyltransferase involved in cell wall biosynthesis